MILEDTETKIEAILRNVLPANFHTGIKWGKNFGGSNYLKIFAACTGIPINGVSGQYPQVVSLCLSSDMELHPQVFGGNGGQCIYRVPNLEDPKEKYLAMKSVKIPFRTPPKNQEAALKAIQRFFENYIKVLKENKASLCHQDVVDYDYLLK